MESSKRYATTRYQRRLAREACGAHATMPVEVVEGSQFPRVRGRSYYWTTPSGKTEVMHPNAYGWRTLYHPSTLRVEVGREWLRAEVDTRFAGGKATIAA